MSAPVASPGLAPAASANLEERAPDLARSHRPLRRASTRSAALVDLAAVARSVEQAASAFQTPKPDDAAYQKAAEWFLDNHYLIARTIRQVRSDLPQHFQRRLPHVGADALPRLLRISRAVIEATHLDFDEAALLQFLSAYQLEAPLTIAELWALPTTLRICVLEVLVETLEVFLPSGRVRGGWSSIPIEPAILVGRAVRALRLLAEIDWKSFFQKTSAVDATLRTDPAGIYARMDFETRDSYRKVVEELAWGSRRTEAEVALLAVAIANEHGGEHRQGHVGYHLVDRGRAALESKIGYRAPFAERLRRSLRARPTLGYLGAIGCGTLLMLWALWAWTVRDLGVAVAAALAALAVVPLSSIAVALTNWAVTRALPPSTLPKLDFSEAIADSCKTLIAIPALVSSTAELDQLLVQLELHYLSSPDPSLAFALLTDHADSDALPDDGPLLAHAEHALDALNRKHGSATSGPFHVLHRAHSWNEAEGVFMGWERKRGKLEELNRLLRGDQTTSFRYRLGDPEGLRGIRFAITLDADTLLPLGAAQRLIGLLAHPLNHAELDPNTGRVIAGYTVVQPRIEAAPAGKAVSWFSRVFTGDTALDIYTRAVSDVYQDLFCSGVYVGKGIYDVDAFARSLEGRIPENAIASHDLLEGVHGRAALATDILLFEQYPQHYLAFARRLHRWVRGDWQLLPWLFPRGRRANEPLPALSLRLIDRWKIADNMRRSLLAPSLLGLLLLGWLVSPEHALRWMLATLAVPLVMSLPSLFSGNLREPLARWALAVVLLPFEAGLAVDAIVRVLVRLFVTRKHLLQWVTSAKAAQVSTRRTLRQVFFLEMRWAILLTLALLGLVAALVPVVLFAAAPLLALWLAAPEIARWASVPPSAPAALGTEDLRSLRQLARRTWLFFETFVGPGDQWLPPDNFQQEPLGRVAHRTSPTNIGLLLIAQVSARDLGYIGPSELSALLRHSLDSIARLERYRGHLLNWYETRTREPLLPRYVSTVDSGNLAAAFIALAKACRDQLELPIVGPARWAGLGDALDLFERAFERLPLPHRPPSQLIAGIRNTLEQARQPGADDRALLLALTDGSVPALARALLEALEASTDHQDVELFREARTWLDRFQHQLRTLRSDLETLLPWTSLLGRAKELGFPLEVELGRTQSISLRDSGETCARVRLALEAQRARAVGDGGVWLEQAQAALATAEARAHALCVEFAALAALADAEALAMDFEFLFDPKRKLFHIGYNVGTDRLDQHYYDLLASEARLASFIAVIQKQAPPAHWYALGRPVTRVGGSVALLSWGGTMFEYLLPSVFMRSSPNTLLAQSEQLAVVAQIERGTAMETPWGVSESGFAELDAQRTYQYRSFGVPGLGLRRGLEEDLVVAPYACTLALPFAPHAVMRNLTALEKLGALGTYGLFEAIDFHPTRAQEAEGEPVRSQRNFSVVRSHMAHHQGMVLAALNNALNENVLVERFHADPLVKTGELLLSERLPSPRVAEMLAQPRADAVEPVATGPVHYAAWLPERNTTAPEVAVLTNGRLTTLMTETGAGWTRWHGLAITRGAPDQTCDGDGLWIYVRDEDSGRSWSATPAPTRARTPNDHVAFHAHKVEFHHRQEGISIRTEIAVAPLDDVEVRYVTLHNETNAVRTLTLASYAEPVLEPAQSAARHPAFSRMFLECEVVPEQYGILASRRKRNPNEASAVVFHRAVWNGADASFVGCEMDRRAFIGRRHDARAPQILTEPLQLKRVGKGGIDPIMSLALSVTLAPSATVSVGFVTAVARTRPAVLEITRRFGSLHASHWAIRDSERGSARRLDSAGVTPAFLPDAMRLVSRLLVPGPQLRPPRETRTESPSQRQLWGHGISGDDPLLVVRVADPEATTLVDELLAVYRYLRACRMPLELVFLDATASGYLADDSGGIRHALVRAGANAWLQQRGGIFVLAIDQLTADQRRRLEASARVFLDAAAGSLHQQLQALPAQAAPLPLFSGALVQTEPARALAMPKLLHFNGYGGFTQDGREYVIDAKAGRATPAPWCNVLANPTFGCLVSESSLGTTWSQNSGENRLTPWRNDPVSDTPAEVLYLRDEETGDVWSPTPLPAGLGADTLVRHGAGYTVYERNSHGLGQKLTVFVAVDSPVKILRLSLENQLARPRRLTATYYVEWVLGVLREEQQSRVISEIDGATRCILARCAWNADFGERVAFVSADRTPHGFTCDRTEFLGRSGNLRDPEALRRWGLSGACEPGVDPCAAIQTHLELAPGQKLQVHFVLGEGRDKKHALELVERFARATEAEAAFDTLNDYWDRLLSTTVVKTPEPAMDVMLNRWLLYQSLSSRFFARSGFYQSSGAFGFRDQLQDVMAFIPALPELARAHILDTAAHQFEEGDVLHWWHPPAGRGVRTRCSDDLLWLPFVVAHYVASTGDVAILEEMVPFLSAPPLRPEEHDRYGDFATGSESESLFEHCRRALERGHTKGPHGLPLIGSGDWNDGMDRVGAKGQGESVWLAWFLAATALDFAKLAQKIGRASEAELWQRRGQALGPRVEAAAWDGEWYVRAFYDDGSPVGSARSRSCQMDSIAQSWAALSGLADPERVRQALSSADERLVRERDRLVLLLNPPFEGARHDPGYIAAYPAGVRENGGQYTHAAAWLGWAHARLGDGAAAERIFSLLNPMLRTQTQAEVERYRVEPYVLAADIYGVAPYTGCGGWTWYTGAAAWTWRLGVEAILGLYRQDGGLRLAPCIPPHWPGFEATLRVGDREVHVVVENPQRTGSGIGALTLDGVAHDSGVLRFAKGQGPIHEVRIVLGEPRIDAAGVALSVSVAARS